MEAIEELVPFLRVENNRLDLKAVSLTHILGLTGTPDGINLIIMNPEILKCLVLLTIDKSEVISKDACLALVNLSAEKHSAEALFDANPNNYNETGLLQLCLKNILNENSHISDPFSMVLSNLTRPESLVEKVVKSMVALNFKIESLVACFCKVNYNKKNQHLNYLGPIFGNITQCTIGRQLICNKETRSFQRLLVFIRHEESVVRRGGITAMLKNICFDTSLHEWLFSEDVDVLPYVLYPLIGPEEFDDDTNEKLPTELQYMDSTKTREDDPDILVILLECLNQLCATKFGREYLRNKGTYEILREFHKFACAANTNKQILIACENVVDILIRTEEEIGNDNLKHLEVPNHVLPKIQKLNENES